MIQRRDVLGASIVLSCYLLLVPVSFLSFFAIALFIFGVAVSAQGLTLSAGKKWRGIYLTIAAGLLVYVFPALAIFGLWGLLSLHIIPAAAASSSLIIAHFTNDGTTKLSEQKDTAL